MARLEEPSLKQRENIKQSLIARKAEVRAAFLWQDQLFYETDISCDQRNKPYSSLGNNHDKSLRP
jgi:hypothetical protein